MEALKLDESHNLECANDLFDTNDDSEKNRTSQSILKTPSRPGNSYSIDEARPKTRDDFLEFQKIIIDKLSSFKDSSMYELLIEGCIRELAGLLEIPQLRKMTGEIQTMLNQKITTSKLIQTIPMANVKKGQKPCKQLYILFSFKIQLC